VSGIPTAVSGIPRAYGAESAEKVSTATHPLAQPAVHARVTQTQPFIAVNLRRKMSHWHNVTNHPATVPPDIPALRLVTNGPSIWAGPPALTEHKSALPTMIARAETSASLVLLRKTNI
jgi:hypothetical protein